MVVGVAVAAFALGGGTVYLIQGDDSDSKPSAVGTPADDTVTAGAEPEPEPSDTEPDVNGLTDAVKYDDGVEVRLSGYTRGVTSAYASVENAPYVAFTVKIENGSKSMVDIGTGYVTCYAGEESRQAEQVFDSEHGLEGMPSMKLRPGRTATAEVACEMPKNEQYLQVELAPSGEAEVAVLAGNVK
ncbi:hypothetical protein [Streptomyces cyaneogriseus]|uniref:hypothetical protein n=1 Tax=Streptomyces cyaneogriseus TaxID=68192 RepID=UPI000699B12F|nr:hypothetical protein [Streptomyces cyaneogriseus]